MEAKCPLFGACGGCTSQHIPYDVQIENKRKVLERAIKGSGIEHASSDIAVFSADPYGYRNRMDFIVAEGKIGLRREGKFWDIIDVPECPIANSGVNGLLAEVRAWFKAHQQQIDAFDVQKRTGTLRYVVLRATDFAKDSSIGFVLNEDSGKLAGHTDLIKAFAASSSARTVVIAHVPADTDQSTSSECFPVKGSAFLHEDMLGTRLEFSSQGFFQNNSQVASKMVDHVRAQLAGHAPVPKAGTLLDLYGGVGTFGIACADLFSDTFIVESFADSIESAKRNIQHNKIPNAQAHCMDAGQLLKLKMKGPLFVITDPPRSGMGMQAIQRLLSLAPRLIVYVSCNPQQLEKELLHFSKRYKIASAALFDMFPQTNHGEAVVVLTRK